MFAELYIENLALIEKTALVWQPGLNVLSGETGAGKSMLLDAVFLLLGSRAGKEQVRRGAERCRVQGVFLPPFSAALRQKLAELGLDFNDEESEELILSREVLAAGRSTCRINLQPVPLAALKAVGRLLINIHGQSEHVSLLEPEKQLHLLDCFGGEDIAAQRLETANAYHAWQEMAKELARTRQENSDDAERRRFLQFQIAELTDAKLRPGETEELTKEAAGLESVQQRSEHAGRAYAALYAGNNAALTNLSAVVDELEELKRIDEQAEPLQSRLQNLYYELEDAALELRSYREAIVDDPERLEEINARLFALKVLGKKYKADENGLLKILEDNQLELDRRENREGYLADLETKERKLSAVYQKSAQKLHQLRQSAGQELAAKITAELKYLQMSKAVFAVDLAAKTPAADGFDEVQFMISPNPGEEMKPVARIASGGEMSRIMLAIKVILASLDEVPTLIFDEIDTGLGGRALGSVSEKLVEVARSTQAICVTHAPVLAAYADNNLLVEKHEQDGRTITTVQELAGEAKVLEISRMLAGDKVTATTRRQADELIEAGRKLR